MSGGLLLVHAHPDDETLATGVTIAHHVGAGDPVHVLTCTLGEEGEVIPPELAHLEGSGEELARWRRGELRAAMAAIGAQHEVLGEDPRAGVLSRWRDSGMAGSEAARHPQAWVGADRDEAADAVAEVITRVAPEVVVTYDRHGGYGHPDHIATHDVTRAAVRSLRPDERPPLYGVHTPRSWALEDRAWLAEHGTGREDWVQPEGELAVSVVDDECVTHEVVDPAAVAAQMEALRAHRTQVMVDPPRIALSNRVVHRLAGREGFALLDLDTGAPVCGDGGPRRGLLPATTGRA